MRLRDLECALSEVDGFSDPELSLEQVIIYLFVLQFFHFFFFEIESACSTSRQHKSLHGCCSRFN